jgi:hypothetical protein
LKIKKLAWSDPGEEKMRVQGKKDHLFRAISMQYPRVSLVRPETSEFFSISSFMIAMPSSSNHSP